MKIDEQRKRRVFTISVRNHSQTSKSFVLEPWAEVFDMAGGEEFELHVSVSNGAPESDKYLLAIIVDDGDITVAASEGSIDDVFRGDVRLGPSFLLDGE